MTALPSLGQRVLVTTKPGTYWDAPHTQWAVVERDNGDGTVEVRVVHDVAEPAEDGTAWTMFPGDAEWQDVPVCPECGSGCADLINEVAA